MDSVEQQLFSDCLVCRLPLVVEVAAAREAMIDVALALATQQLQRLSLIEDSRAEDGAADEHGDARADYLRLEAKIDMLFGLMSRLLDDPLRKKSAQPVVWSHKGIALESPMPVLKGDAVLVRVSLMPVMPESLELPAVVVQIEDGVEEASAGMRRLWLAFDTRDEPFNEALQRHLFRLHRRAVSQSKR